MQKVKSPLKAIKRSFETLNFKRSFETLNLKIGFCNQGKDCKAKMLSKRSTFMSRFGVRSISHSAGANGYGCLLYKAAQHIAPAWQWAQRIWMNMAFDGMTSLMEAGSAYLRLLGFVGFLQFCYCFAWLYVFVCCFLNELG